MSGWSGFSQALHRGERPRAGGRARAARVYGMADLLGETKPRPSVVTVPIDAGGADRSRALPSRRDLATVVQGSTHEWVVGPGQVVRVALGRSGVCQRQLNDNPPLLPVVAGVHAGKRAPEQVVGMPAKRPVQAAE